MNKRLEKMKTDIQNRIKRNTGFLVCTSVFLLTVASGIIPVQLESEQSSDYVYGFQLGFLFVLVLKFLADLVQYRKALKDEKLLKQLYYKENDERMCFINQQVGKSTMSVLTVIMVIATIITGYFNITVFCTMCVVTVLQSVVQILLKWYYTNCVSGSNDDEA